MMTDKPKTTEPVEYYTLLSTVLKVGGRETMNGGKAFSRYF